MAYDLFHTPQSFPTFQNTLIKPWITTGSAVTNKPQILIEPLGTLSTGWSTLGTGVGINAPSNFTGNLLDLQKAGFSQLSIGSTGTINLQTLASSTHGMIISGSASGAIIQGTYNGSSSTRGTIYLNGGPSANSPELNAGTSGMGGLISSTNRTTSTSIRGYYASNTALDMLVSPMDKDAGGGYTGNGHTLTLTGGKASVSTTGGSGGYVYITGGAAGSAGAATNNNGGNVILRGGAATGSGTAGVVEIQNSTSAQSLNIYGTYTDASNYVRLALASTSTTVSITAETSGTGADDIDISLVPAGIGSLKFGTFTASMVESLVSAGAGYITIKDSGGTTRKLAIVA